MKSSTHVVIIAVIIIVVLTIIFIYRVDGYCNCTGIGFPVDRPTNTFWRGAWQRNCADSLDARSMWGSYPNGCSSPSLGWAQTPERPFDSSCYSDKISSPYTIGPNELRDIVRDTNDALLYETSPQSSFGQELIVSVPVKYPTSDGSCCKCTPSDKMSGTFLPLANIQYAQLPPGAVTSSTIPSSVASAMRYGSYRGEGVL